MMKKKDMNAREALVIGNFTYADGEKNLAVCKNDAYYVATLLRHHEIVSPCRKRTMNKTGECEGPRVPNFNVSELYNLRAEDILQKVDDLFEGEGELALFYFSGHGREEWWGTGIVGSDNKSISLEDIMHRANASRYRNRIIILDSCFSGAAGEAFKGYGDTTRAVSFISPGVSVLCACQADQLAFVGSDGTYSCFTSMLIDALDGRAASIDGLISLGSIYDYIDRNMARNAQRPVFKTNVNGFCSLRRVTPVVQEDDLRRMLGYFKADISEIGLNPSFEFTNKKNAESLSIEPYADEANVKIFKDLQKLVSAGLAEPVGEEHMYYAAMNSKSCRLTRSGRFYWHLLKGPEPPKMP